ncbi:2975_t:CDS:1, partial [Scutellospora calospora]
VRPLILITNGTNETAITDNPTIMNPTRMSAAKALKTAANIKPPMLPPAPTNPVTIPEAAGSI